MKKSSGQLPFVSICTPTFNRRPFIPILLKCFENQTYPKDRMEWIIIDDGTDKIEDLISSHPQIKYFKYEEKMTLGKKRNIMHQKCKGSIIVYMDDDDYYPPERVSHAVETLQKNPNAMCAGSSEMHIYFKHIDKMIKFGPYGPNHSTAATFAFRKQLLKQTRYNNDACLAEEKVFLKNYSVPFVQLDTLKTILVFSHIHNSFDKKTLLGKNDPFINDSTLTVDDFVKQSDIKKFFMEDIDKLLDNYEQGSPNNKKDVLNQIEELTIQRKKIAEDMQIKQTTNPLYPKLMEQVQIIQNLYIQNNMLTEKIKYMEEKMNQLLVQSINDRKELKQIKEQYIQKENS
uniref:Glycosyltransferase 2-like domain-containing protein n=1 Tax=viral metagenome TaxID=1070528 RepID=A0A6C0KW10_9ZZZZ